MKLTRKLIPAFAMLLVSVVLMSTASFAWFSMNGDVKATGMSVSATAPAALWISTQKDAGFGTNITLTGIQGQIAPVTDDLSTTQNTPANAGNWQFHVLDEDGYAAVDNAGKVNGGALPTDAVEQGLAKLDDGSNVLKQQFFLRLEGKNNGTEYEKKAIKANVTVDSEGTDAIWKCLRVAIVAADATVSNEAANDTTFSKGGSVIYEISELDTAVEGDTAFLTLAAQETIQIFVYVWFEGEDTDCTNNNSQSLDTFSVDLQFVAGPAA